MSSKRLTIREANETDWPAIWKIVEPVFRSGETNAVATDISEEAAREVWFASPQKIFVAEDTTGVIGTYYIQPNQGGPGSHICNSGYIVDENARGRGVASQMCEHSQQAAIELGFKAMQYNLVVSTNEGAVRLWQKHGFEIVGTLPHAFRHPKAGFVDAFVMFKTLDSSRAHSDR